VSGQRRVPRLTGKLTSVASLDQLSKNVVRLRESKSAAPLLEARRIAPRGSNPASVRRVGPNESPYRILLPHVGRHRHARKKGRKVLREIRFDKSEAARIAASLRRIYRILSAGY
jgi:hypothetical protein